MSESKPSRRAVLGGLAVSVVSPWALAGCFLHSDPVDSSHPALAPPRGNARLALLELPGDVGAARRAVRTLAHRARAGRSGSAVMLGLAASMFDRVGLVSRRPRQLVAMPAFAGDVIDAGRSGGDLLVQVEGDTAAGATASARWLLDGLPDVRVRWQETGSRSENRVEQGRALTRDPLGFVEGIGNPDSRIPTQCDAVALVGRDAGEPQWAIGGSYGVLRVVRLAKALWDAEPVAKQERVIGRRRDGSWLDGTASTSEPDFSADPDGAVIPLEAHARRAHPQNPGEPGPQLIRRGWSYATTAADGQPDEGLLFLCYQADLTTGFLAVMDRLPGQTLDRYTLTVGGGYYFVPPADQSSTTRWEDAVGL